MTALGSPTIPLTVERRIDVINVLRGFAALLVCLFHVRQMVWVGLPATWRAHGLALQPDVLLAYALAPVSFGSIGVSIFFVISGYVIHDRAARGLAAGGDAPLDAGRFLARRAIRIYPTLVLALLLTLACDSLSKAITPGLYLGDADARTALINLAALQGVFARPFGSNTALWSLAVELQFYLVYPLALWVRRRVGGAWMLALAAAVSLGGYLVLERNGLTAFPQYYLAWWIGAYVAERQAEGRMAPRPLLFGSAMIAAGCAAHLAGAGYAAFILWALGFAPLLLVLVQRTREGSPPRGLVAAGLAKLSPFSYSLYSVHMPMIVLIRALVFGGAQQDDILVALAVCAVLVAAARGLYEIAEKPSVAYVARMRR